MNNTFKGTALKAKFVFSCTSQWDLGLLEIQNVFFRLLERKQIHSQVFILLHFICIWFFQLQYIFESEISTSLAVYTKPYSFIYISIPNSHVYSKPVFWTWLKPIFRFLFFKLVQEHLLYLNQLTGEICGYLLAQFLPSSPVIALPPVMFPCRFLGSSSGAVIKTCFSASQSVHCYAVSSSLASWLCLDESKSSLRLGLCVSACWLSCQCTRSWSG